MKYMIDLEIPTTWKFLLQDKEVINGKNIAQYVKLELVSDDVEGINRHISISCHVRCSCYRKMLNMEVVHYRLFLKLHREYCSVNEKQQQYHELYSSYL